MNPRCGTRARYASGCRCPLCRWANKEYQRVRKAGLARKVPAELARAHIADLRARGVGRRAIADACDVDPATVGKLAAGKKVHVFRRTLDRILSVDDACRADGSLIPAGPTKRLLSGLIERGYTQKQIAIWLGYRRMLQFTHATIRARNAMRVERLCALLEEGKISRGGPGLKADR